MTLTDPRDALAEKSDFIGYLVGLAGLADMVRALATGSDRPAQPAGECDDFVYVLLGLASTGAAIERMAECVAVSQNPTATPSPRRWLR